MYQYQARLSIDLDAIASNWTSINAYAPNSEVGAVVKANAYGLGMSQIAKALYRKGCRTFFVANLDEALSLGRVGLSGIEVVVLQGCYPGEEAAFLQHRFLPVIVSLEMLTRWCDEIGKGAYSNPGCYLKFDSGMNRLGFKSQEFTELLNNPSLITMSGAKVFMSHLACADDPTSSLNHAQLAEFNSALSRLRAVAPRVRASLANSEGIKLGEHFHFDLLRPGIALYGGVCSVANLSIRTAVSVSAPVVQVKSILPGDAVGYGADYVADQAKTCVVVAVGYGDGLLRSWSPKGSGWYNGYLPVLGRVSMDSIVLDVSSLPAEARPGVGDYVELLGECCKVTDFARYAGTIPYEIYTRLGDRLVRNYKCADVSIDG